MMAAHTFRLLDLPAELRLMVYEFLPITTRQHTFEDKIFCTYMPKATTPSLITLVTKSATVSLLSTCRQIKHEFEPVLEKQLQQLRSEPLRFIVDSTSLPAFIDMGHCVSSNIMFQRSRVHEDCVYHIPKIEPLKSEREEDRESRKRDSHSILHHDPEMRSFVAKCARYGDARNTKLTIMAIWKHPSHDLEGLITAVADARENTPTAAYSVRHLGWMLVGVAGDEEYRPFRTVNDFRHHMLMRFYRCENFGVEDASETEWQKVWQEGDVLTLGLERCETRYRRALS